MRPSEVWYFGRFDTSLTISKTIQYGDTKGDEILAPGLKYAAQSIAKALIYGSGSGNFSKKSQTGDIQWYVKKFRFSPFLLFFQPEIWKIPYISGTKRYEEKPRPTFHNSWIGIFRCLFNPPFSRAILLSGHAGDAVLIVMSSPWRHWLSDRLPLSW